MAVFAVVFLFWAIVVWKDLCMSGKQFRSCMKIEGDKYGETKKVGITAEE